MVANVFNASTLALGRLRQANLDEFEANLMFLAISRNEIMSLKKKKAWVLIPSQTCFVNFPTFRGLSFYCLDRVLLCIGVFGVFFFLMKFIIFIFSLYFLWL